MFGPNIWSYNEGSLKIKGCKIEEPLYWNLLQGNVLQYIDREIVWIVQGYIQVAKNTDVISKGPHQNWAKSAQGFATSNTFLGWSIAIINAQISSGQKTLQFRS